MNPRNLIELSSVNSLALPLTTCMFSHNQEEYNYYRAVDLEKGKKTKKSVDMARRGRAGRWNNGQWC